MGIIEIVLTSIGLAMDAFATSICKGLSMKNRSIKNSLIVAIYFGLFQAIMPLLGYSLGNTFGDLIIKIDHWIVFILLSIIGIDMIKDVYQKDNKVNDEKLDFKSMFPFALATSIDAFAVGITLSFLKVNIVLSILLIGLITFTLSFIGVKIGNKFGNKYEKKAQLLGGIILIIIGLKILLEHLSII